MKRSLGDVVRRVLEAIGVKFSDEQAAETISAQRTEHLQALEDVRRTKDHALTIRREANEVITEARRAERILEGRAPKQ